MPETLKAKNCSGKVDEHKTEVIFKSLKDDKETKTTEQTNEKEESGAQDNAQDNGLPKTQEELDALIEKRLKRERKKMEKEQQTAPPAQTGTQQQENTPPPADTAAAQENLLLKAQLSAIKDGVNPQYVEDAVYLAC